MNCASCNSPIPNDALFCPNCGAKSAPETASQMRTFSGLGTIAPMRESTATALDPGTRFAERYAVIRKIGEGSMGVVYLATDTHTGEEIVLKLIHPDLVSGDQAVARLMAEGLTARQIRHPNVVAVYDVSQWNGQPYFTMEYVPGGTLRSWLVNAMRSGQETSLDTAVGLIRSMLAGIGEAHRMGVVHRDLKPENVLLAGDPYAGDFNLKILDFGIAKAVGGQSPVRSSGGAVGTPLYMAPEQMTAADVVGPAADLYSLSVMFYELLMEALPQAGWEPVSAHRPDVPKEIDELLRKGLSVRPRSRIASVADYVAALDAALHRPAPRAVVQPVARPAVEVPSPTPAPTPPSAAPAQSDWQQRLRLLYSRDAFLQWYRGLSTLGKFSYWVVAVFVVLLVIAYAMDPYLFE